MTTSIITKYWLEFAMGIVATALTLGFKSLMKKHKELDNKNKAIADGVTALLRDRIIQACNYYRGKGYCPVYGLENIESMYKEYHALGGNGTVTTLVQEMHHMPRTEDKNGDHGVHTRLPGNNSSSVADSSHWA